MNADEARRLLAYATAPEFECFDLLGHRIHADDCQCAEERLRRALGYRQRDEGFYAALWGAVFAEVACVATYDSDGDFGALRAVGILEDDGYERIIGIWCSPEDFERVADSRPMPELLGAGYYFGPFDSMSALDAARLIAALNK